MKSLKFENGFCAGITLVNIHRIIFSVLFVISTNWTFSQNNSSGRVIYDVLEGNYSNEVTPTMFGFKNRSKIMDDDFAPKSILLEFSGETSYCKLTDESTMYNNNWSDFKELSLEVAGDTFFNYSEGERINTRDKNGKLYLISKNMEEIQWKLENETKNINGYICNKAVRYTEYSRWGKTWIVTHIAWYTKDIPVPFGPFDNINLPGLVLEVEKIGGHTEFKYVVRNLEMDSTDAIQIEKPSLGVLITQKEYDRQETEKLNRLLGRN